MTSSRTILIAGAGIGGLTAALSLVRAGYRIVVAEQADQLSDIGAGLQLSPNATRILIGLGLEPRLIERAVVPEGLSIRAARSGHEISFMPLGRAMEQRYGAPYWIIHRGDLQAVLAEAVREQPGITLKLGTRLEDLAVHAQGITAHLQHAGHIVDVHAFALIGADGLWSVTRERLGETAKPRFRNRTAWRATLPATALPASLRRPMIRLWLGEDSHLVLYPVRAGKVVNVVAIVRDRWSERGWSAPGQRDELLRCFPDRSWSGEARDILRLPERWTKWALFDSDRIFHGRGPITLLGDAAHPMLPFLAQGAAMAIEDAAVLTDCLASHSADLQRGLRRYESLRAERLRRVQSAAQTNGRTYHLSGAPAFARNLAMRLIGGERLRSRYDWLYDWRPE